MTKFVKETRHWLYGFIKKKKKPTTVNSAKCKTTVRACDAFCPLTQIWRVNCPSYVLLHFPIRSMTRTLFYWCLNRAVITNYVREFCCSLIVSIWFLFAWLLIAEIYTVSEASLSFIKKKKQLTLASVWFCSGLYTRYIQRVPVFNLLFMTLQQSTMKINSTSMWERNIPLREDHAQMARGTLLSAASCPNKE